MKVLNTYVRLTALLLSLVFSSSVLAVEPTTNENKNNGAADTISNADDTNNANSNSAASVKQDSIVSETQDNESQIVSDADDFRKEMDERYRQMQLEQEEAYQRHLQRRKEFFANNPEYNVPPHILERRNEYLKQMEDRRALHTKMMEQNRKAAEERREAMRIKMHQTCAPEPAQKA